MNISSLKLMTKGGIRMKFSLIMMLLWIAADRFIGNNPLPNVFYIGWMIGLLFTFLDKIGEHLNGKIGKENTYDLKS